MHRTLALIVTAAFALSLAGAADAAKPCKDEKGKYMKCPPAAAAPAVTPVATRAMATGGAPNCKKGKACGHSCIAVDKVCHK
jgi:hypothetical protein